MVLVSGSLNPSQRQCTAQRSLLITAGCQIKRFHPAGSVRGFLNGIRHTPGEYRAIRQDIFHVIPAGHHRIKDEVPVLADFRPECFTFGFFNQAHGYTGQTAFTAVLGSVVIPVGIYIAFHGTGLDHSDIHPGDFRTEFHSEGHGISFPAGPVQDDITFSLPGKSVSLNSRYTEAELAGWNILKLIYSPGACLVIYNSVALGIHQFYHKTAGNLLLAVQCAGEIVIIVNRSLYCRRINSANADLPCFRIGKLKSFPEVFPAAGPTLEMVAKRFIPGNCICTPVFRKECADLISIRPHARQFEPSVLPGSCTRNFSSVPFLDR